MRVLGISGSLRRGSHNSALLRAAAELLPPPTELEMFDGLKAVEPYDEDDDPAREPGGGAADRTSRASALGRGPAGARRLREAIDAADAILIATPEYNHSVPGQLKNALDWVSRPLATNPLRNKPAAVVGASTGAFGAVWAQAELRKILAAIGARVVEADVAVGHAPTRFDEGGTLVDDDLREQLGETVDALVSAVAERHELARSAA
jgi:chromate reductase, NAD(P)H dehydrogenase (quinone)